MSEKGEYMKVTVELPKPVYDFYKALAASRKESLESFIISELLLDLDSFLDVSEDIKGLVIEQYGLEEYCDC